MKESYHLTKDGMNKTNQQAGNLTVYKQATKEDRHQFIETHDLPEDIFYFDDMASIAPRIEYLNNEHLGKTMIFVLAHIIDTKENSSVEARLESHTFILGEEQLFWFINEGVSNLDEEVFQEYEQRIDCFESLIMHTGLHSYAHFTEELRKQKRMIDDLSQQANHKTSNSILISVADTERNMVILEHTLDTQEQAFTKLLDNASFISKLDNDNLVHDIHWYNRQVNQLVHMYRDLLDTVSRLFSDIMSNSLNKIMKFLSSLSLIFASFSLVAELWGMNTGGLPFEFNEYGSFIMIGFSFFAGFLMYLFLKKKKYFDD